MRRREITIHVGPLSQRVSLFAQPWGTDGTAHRLSAIATLPVFGDQNRHGIVSTADMYEILAIIADSLEQRDPGAFDRWCLERAEA